MEDATRVRIRRALIRTTQGVLILVAFLVGLVVWVLAVAFGDCAGWKGSGTCPRVPYWDWEVFRLGFVAGAVPAAVTWFVSKPGWRRLVMAVVGGIAAGGAAGLFAVVITAR